ncbi:MAG TPA: hypothetical protein PLY93_06205 [Turneriella sp.]|nr:hypothetical protein [Turneriella sp.]
MLVPEDLERIVKECYWDSHTSPERIVSVAKGSDLRLKKRLFEKILLNSTNLFRDLTVFNNGDLAGLIESYTVPSFNKEYTFRRKNLAEVYFLHKPLLIPELQWRR